MIDNRLRIIVTANDGIFDKTVAESLPQAIEEHTMRGIENPFVTPARGNTQADAYSIATQSDILRESLKKARYVALDDLWFSPETQARFDQELGRGPKRFCDFTHEELIHPVFGEDVPAGHWIPFQYGFEISPQDAVTTHKKALVEITGLNIAFLGIGSEGDDHWAQIGPGVDFKQGVFAPELSEGMKRSNRDYNGLDLKDTRFDPDCGLSLGPANLPDCIIVAAKGTKKASSAFNMLCAPVSPDISTTFLRTKKDLTVILDEAAAEKALENREHLPEHAELEFIR